MAINHRCLQTRAYPGIAWVILNHACSYQEDRKWRDMVTAYSISLHNHMYSVQCSDKIRFQHSQVLPRYPHSSAGTYVSNCYISLARHVVKLTLKLLSCPPFLQAQARPWCSNSSPTDHYLPESHETSIIGAYRPGRTRALPGLFWTMRAHIKRTGSEETWSLLIA